MFTFPNLLSLLRIPLALLFFQNDPFLRAAAVVLAMITDVLDGYLARKYQQISRLGTWLDPFTDKLFVATTLSILFMEHRLQLWEVIALVSRDIALIAFGIYLTLKGRFSEHQVYAIWWGKVSTALQFVVLLTLIFYYPLPSYVYFPFILIGILAFAELRNSFKQRELYFQDL